ncbi:restriction endonuclease fold toxin 5 domain-containing protein [Achromobacter sp. NFACC18-2]|uniref:restriction endonuclease fold toxin 5 domain-containing protein n=1 Tax=Achromobacter sp. NFACC18-2 TaxID=1564112 RepID=UPI000B84CC06
MPFRRFHPNWRAYEYQARITGFAYDTEYCKWSDVWNWQGTAMRGPFNIDFDGFISATCLLQETQGNYDSFIDGDGEQAGWFGGFKDMRLQASRQTAAVRSNPPARLRWYFQTPRPQAFLRPLLNSLGAESVVIP